MAIRLSALAALIAVLASPAMAAEPTNMFMINGECQHLVAGADDLTGQCRDQAMQMVYDDGRTGFYALYGDFIITFSGPSDEVIGNEIHQRLDKVILGQGENDTRSIPVKGTCIYQNPFEGVPATIDCTARRKDGTAYEVKFVTDGTAPEDAMATN